MTLEELGSLLIRISVAWLFLTGFWYDVRSFKSTEEETGLLFKWHTDFFATAGMILMGAGAVSILLGIFPRLGALALATFLIPASFIHFRSRDAAAELKKKVLDRGAADQSLKDDIDELGTLGSVGHYSSGLKNLALIGPMLYLVLAGGKFPIIIGLSGDWTLQGLLIGN